MGENNFSSRPDKQTETPISVSAMTKPASSSPAPKKTKAIPMASICTVALCLILCLATVFSSVALASYFSNRKTAAALQNFKPVQQVTVIEQNNPVIDNTGTSYTEEDRVIAVDRADDSAVSIYTYSSQETYQAGVRYNGGSGVVWSGSTETAEANFSYIVTNQHVIENGVLFEVITVDGTAYPATLVGSDVYSDLAVLKVETGLIQAKKAPISDLKKGMSVIAIGNPTGTLPGSVSAGIISSLTREINTNGVYRTVLQTDAAINNGNSGGGLFDMQGRLVAIVNAKRNGDGVWGIGFCIPIDIVTEVCTELIESGFVTGRPQLGISLFTYDGSVSVDAIREAFPQIAEHISPIGMYVTQTVAEDSPFRVGDYLYSLDNTPVTTMEEVRYLLSQKKVGDTMEVTVFRNGQTVETYFGKDYTYSTETFTVTLTQRVEN